MPTSITFVRHAEGTHNVKNEYDNPIHTDAVLTPTGLSQIKEAVSNGIVPFSTYDAVFCSSLRRCQQTLLGLYPESKDSAVFVDDKLIEQPQGYHICNRRIEKYIMKENIPSLWNLTMVSEYNPYIFDSDTDKNRIYDFTYFIKENYKDKKVLVVTHCTWINNWFALFKNKADVWLKNCEIVTVSI
jgi:broad specificity phosphatase PhoE